MPEITGHEPGMFSWADLATGNAAAAKAFYTGLFGLEAVDVPIDDQGAVYTQLTRNGKAAAAMYALSPEMAAQGIPPHWSSYFTVESADDTAARAKELGGKVLVEPFDVFTAGRMAALTDPDGAGFAVWQPKDDIGAQVFAEPGTLVWVELLAHDLDAEQGFYEGLFGWSGSKMGVGNQGRPYTVFEKGGRNAAGMMKLEPAWGPVPPNWEVYFAVGNCDATVAQAASLGGGVVFPATEVPEVGRFAGLTDPEGVHFSILQMAETNATTARTSA